MPALNEGATIFQVINNLPKNFEGIDKTEILVVNDGSTDNTVSEAERAGAKVVSHIRNQGVGMAFRTAVKTALEMKADILVTIDADGQFDSNQIKDFIKPILNKEADFCIGNRFFEKKPDNMPSLKHWGNMRVNKLVGIACNERIYDASCGFRAYSRECLLSLNLLGRFTYTHETIIDLTFKSYKVAQIPVSVKYFENRVSRVAHNLTRYAYQSGKIILKSVRDNYPLKFFGSLAIIVFIFSLIGAFFIFSHWLVYDAITPYKSIAFGSLFGFIISLLLALLALIADMLGRILLNQDQILYNLKKQRYDGN